MSVVGEYKFDSIMTFGEDGPKYLTAEDLMNKTYPAEASADFIEHEKAENRALAMMVLKIGEDGTLKSLVPIPEGVTQEMVDEAVAAGEVTIEDGLICDKVYQWEERDGVPYYNTGIKNLEDENPQDEWAKLIDDDGYVSFMMMRFVRK